MILCLEKYYYFCFVLRKVFHLSISMNINVRLSNSAPKTPTLLWLGKTSAVLDAGRN